jgi:flagellar biosynthesis activator protein FlaF
VVYRLQYANVQEEAPDQSKMREREILQRSIDLLRLADSANAEPFASTTAVHFTSRVWTAFLEDLANPDNQLPKEARASLISIGIWILKELDAIRSGTSLAYGDIIDISEIIRDGLN